MRVKVTLEDGNHFITRFNGSEEDICSYYRIGSLINMGVVADDMKRIIIVETDPTEPGEREKHERTI